MSLAFAMLPELQAAASMWRVRSATIVRSRPARRESSGMTSFSSGIFDDTIYNTLGSSSAGGDSPGLRNRLHRYLRRALGRCISRGHSE